MSTASARETAIRAVGRVRRDDAWIQTAIEAEISRANLDDRDRAFATASAYGTVAHLGTLDEVIGSVADRPSAIEPQVRDALRIATHELLFMGTPSRAAVSEGVNAVRAIRPRAAGYSNAVLRKIADKVIDFPFGDPETDIEALARLTGHPSWIANLLVRDLGHTAARTMMTADAQSAPLYLAHNPFLGSFGRLIELLQDEGAEPEPSAIPGSVRCANASATARSKVLQEGFAVVSDLSGQAIVAGIPISAKNHIADIAAGRGTKTLLLQAAAQRVGSEVLIKAVDSHGFKIDVLTKRMESLGVPGVLPLVADATDTEALRSEVGEVDVALIDAPCSGLGTLRRHPEKRWTLTPKTIEELAVLGADLLEAASQVVRPGGFVVYSTCTVTHAENAGVVDAFLQRNPETYESLSLRGQIHTEFDLWVTDAGYFQSLPELDGPDGHFAALLRRKH